jgi:predicted GTPase
MRAPLKDRQMKRIERIRSAMLRWDRLLAVVALAMPFLVAMLAGFAWMVEHGWLFAFIAVSISIGVLVGLTRIATSWRRRRSNADARPLARLHAKVDPDWSVGEKRAFETARNYIDEKTTTALPWEQLQPVAEEVVRRVANASGKQGKGVLNFTIPEALLLIDRVVVRLRGDIRDHVPFADSLSVGTLHWLWQHRDIARKVKTHGTTAWRVVRAINSLPVAILREIEGAIAEGHSSFVTGEGTAVVQALLLEEVAAAAVDLYSGKLRFSDAELLDLRLAAGEEDRARLATPDMPLRVAVAGQFSAGKSSLINALLGSNMAETDIIPTTDGFQAYLSDFGGVPTALLDMPGLDGSKRVMHTVLEDLVCADLVIWTIRANRPAREIDRAAIAELRQFFNERPERRMPPVIVVITCVDAIFPSWPFSENFLTDDAMTLVNDIVAAVEEDIGDTQVHPVPVALTEPDWNVDTLRDRVDGCVGEALMAQRNRLRVESNTSGVLSEVSRAGRGLSKGILAFSPRSLLKDDMDD